MRKFSKLYIDPTSLPPSQNTNGIVGEKCDACGGFGYTLALGGKTLNCNNCDNTGVKLPTRRELQTQISELRKDLHSLKKALINTLQMNGKTLKEVSE